MTALSKTALKALWKAYFQPTSADFSNLIDSWTDYSAPLEMALAQVSAGATGVPVFDSAGATGIALLSAATTTIAQNTLGAGAVGKQVFTAATTAAAVTGLGAGTIGSNVFQSSQANSAAGLFGAIHNHGTTAGTIALNLSNGLNFRLVLNGAVTFNAMTNVVPGDSGVIEVIQDGTGGRAASFSTSFIWEGGSFPGLTTTASARDLIAYYVAETSLVYARIGLAYA
jgi:hypothetical protein